MDNTVLFDDMILDPLHEDNTLAEKNVPSNSWDVVSAKNIVWYEGASLNGAEVAMDLDGTLSIGVSDDTNMGIHKLSLEDLRDGIGAAFPTTHSCFNFSSNPIRIMPSAPDCTTFPGDRVDKNNTTIVPSRRIDVPLEKKCLSAKYVRPADWDIWKRVIQNLYMNHNLTLDDVIDVMKHRHNFNAT